MDFSRFMDEIEGYIKDNWTYIYALPSRTIGTAFLFFTNSKHDILSNEIVLTRNEYHCYWFQSHLQEDKMVFQDINQNLMPCVILLMPYFPDKAPCSRIKQAKYAISFTLRSSSISESSKVQWRRLPWFNIQIVCFQDDIRPIDFRQVVVWDAKKETCRISHMWISYRDLIRLHWNSDIVLSSILLVFPACLFLSIPQSIHWSHPQRIPYHKPPHWRVYLSFRFFRVELSVKWSLFQFYEELHKKSGVFLYGGIDSRIYPMALHSDLIPFHWSISWSRIAHGVPEFPPCCDNVDRT